MDQIFQISLSKAISLNILFVVTCTTASLACDIDWEDYRYRIREEVDTAIECLEGCEESYDTSGSTGDWCTDTCLQTFDLRYNWILRQLEAEIEDKCPSLGTGVA